MQVREANIALVVSTAIMVLGAWITGWSASDGEAQAIFVCAFAVGAVTLVSLLYRSSRRREAERLRR